MLEGNIVRQKPSSTEMIGKSGLVNLEISKGLPPSNIKLMPNVVGLFLETAEQVLVGCEINFATNYVQVDDPEKQDLVLSQNPQSDAVLSDTTKIQIEVGKFQNMEESENVKG